MKTIDPIGLLVEARKYTNKSVSNAFLELAYRCAHISASQEELETFSALYYLVQNEIDGCADSIREENYKFISVKQFAENLSEDGQKMSEEELLQELVCAGILCAEEESNTFAVVGASLSDLDKGYIKQEDGKWYISHFGMFKYQQWKRNGGENYWKNIKV